MRMSEEGQRPSTFRARDISLRLLRISLGVPCVEPITDATITIKRGTGFARSILVLPLRAWRRIRDVVIRVACRGAARGLVLVFRAPRAVGEVSRHRRSGGGLVRRASFFGGVRSLRPHPIHPCRPALWDCSGPRIPFDSSWRWITLPNHAASTTGGPWRMQPARFVHAVAELGLNRS
jgi:hypothetical protein